MVWVADSENHRVLGFGADAAQRGGVRADGHCEVLPEMRCVWVEAYAGSQRMDAGREAIKVVQIAVDWRLAGRSSWLKVAREKGEQARGKQVGMSP